VEPSASQRPNTQWTLPAAGGESVAQSDAIQPRASGSTSVANRSPQTGADRNWSAYDVASTTQASEGKSAARGSAYAMPPTPETAHNYSTPASATVDMLPTMEGALPRY
jgi:hypothetical protein